MATVSKTFTENASGSYKSTWTVTTTKADFNVTGSTFSLAIPSGTAKFVYSGKNYGSVSINGKLSMGSSNYSTWVYSKYSSMASGTAYTLPTINVSTSTVNTSTIWNSSNPTTRSVPVVCHFTSTYLGSFKLQSDTESMNNEYYSTADQYWTICNATLDIPPTVTLGTPTYATPQYAGLGSYSVPVTQAKALYGGNVSEITLTVGADTATQSYSSSTVTNQTISLVPSQPGTFTPTLTVTDSRGQTKTESLSQITVNAYTAPTLSFDVSRCTSAGLIDVEGTYGLVTANIAYVDALAELTQPTVSAVDENGSSVTVSASWYRSWDAVNGVSNAVNWTNYQPTSPVTLYAIVSVTGGSFSPNASYAISITPTDNMGGVAQTITQSLSTAFFTIDFQAGGKEIAFGAPANDNLTSYPDGLFRCDMDAQFNGDVKFNGDVAAVGDSTFTTGDTEIENPYFSLDTTAQTGTTDGDLYAAIVTLGWDSDVIV